MGTGWRARTDVRQDRPITDLTATKLTETHRSTVTEDQIDHLGHMNVRFYGVNASAASAALVRAMHEGAAVQMRQVDVYTRHHREQLRGASLVVCSGVLAASDAELRLYHELRNEETGVLAATFVHRLRSPDGALPAALVERARSKLVTVPEHGAPRSIALDADPLAAAPALAVVRDRQLAMRKPRTVAAEECDENGEYAWSNAPGLTWGGEPVSDRAHEWFMEGPEGEKIGWASMETRMNFRRLPRVGDRIQSFSAVIGLRDKTSHRIMWAYDIEREDLLVTFEIVNLAFDVGRRAPMSIPARNRAIEEASMHEDLAPDA